MAVGLEASSLTSWSTVDFQKVKGMRELFSKVLQSWQSGGQQGMETTALTLSLCR